MGTLINTGINYRVRDGDSLFDISKRFFTSVGHILSVNPDIEGDSPNSELLLGDRLWYEHCQPKEQVKRNFLPVPAPHLNTVLSPLSVALLFFTST